MSTSQRWQTKRQEELLRKHNERILKEVFDNERERGIFQGNRPEIQTVSGNKPREY